VKYPSRFRDRPRLVIDTDIGTDDAVALLLALKTPRAVVEAITTVAGNTDVDSCVRNARYVLELCGTDVPVYRGASAALAPRGTGRPTLHGDDGLGSLGLRPLNASAASGIASDALVRLARANPRQLTLVTLGPLTNLALALSQAPDLVRLIHAAIVMGGAANGHGTVTDSAEFNIWADPEAASLVFNSGLPITLVNIEPSRGPCAFDAADLARLAETGTDAAAFVGSMCRAAATAHGSERAGLPDAIAMAVAIAPQIVTSSGTYHVDVKTFDERTRGEIRVDQTSTLRHGPNLTLVESVDSSAYKRMIFCACA